MTDGAVPLPAGPQPWWESRLFIAALMLLSIVPLIYPPVPPLVDLLGHMGRYRVELDVDSSPWLARYYGFEWAPIGNLGVDLLVMPLGRLIGLEPAVKLIVMAIPPLTTAGFLWVAREVHGRIPPTALFALPLVYATPFLYGFVNFCLAMALAFLAFGLWLNLSRRRALKARAIAFVPISFILFFTHVFGWGTLGLLCFSAEAVRQHDEGAPWFKAAFRAALQVFVMALPLLVILAWRSGTGGMTEGWFDWPQKLTWVAVTLRDRWQTFDLVSLAVVAAMLLAAVLSRRLAFSRNLAFSALVLFAAFLVLPSQLFGSFFADMRLVAFVIAVALLAVRVPADPHWHGARLIAFAGLAFLVVRLAATTFSLAIAADDQSAKLKALDHVPTGARVATLVGHRCGLEWPLPRNTHLGAMVIVRRDGFANDQWLIPGANLLQLRYRGAGPLSTDPSQTVVPQGCGFEDRQVDQVLKSIPRGGFDYLWLIDPPAYDLRLTQGMQAVWRGAGSTLYRIPS